MNPTAEIFVCYIVGTGAAAKTKLIGNPDDENPGRKPRSKTQIDYSFVVERKQKSDQIAELKAELEE